MRIRVTHPWGAGAAGVACAKILLATMAPEPIVFALSNPDPEIHPAVAHRYAAIVATGRSDYPNQTNNVLAFPGVFLGALNSRATTITEAMKIAAAQAIADITRDELDRDHIVPSALDPRVVPAVAAAVEQASSPSQSTVSGGVRG